MNITLPRAVIEQALEALEQWNTPLYKRGNIITALRTALEQPEQEPVAMVESVATVVSESGNKEITMSWWHEPALPVGTKLYTAPPQRKPLSDEQRDAIARQAAENDWHDYEIIDAVEAAHGIREESNT